MRTYRNFKAELAAAHRVALRHYNGNVPKARAAVDAWLHGLLEGEAARAKRKEG